MEPLVVLDSFCLKLFKGFALVNLAASSDVAFMCPASQFRSFAGLLGDSPEALPGGTDQFLLVNSLTYSPRKTGLPWSTLPPTWKWMT